MRALLLAVLLACAATSSYAQASRNGGACGGFVAMACGADEWCDYPPGSYCGRTDHPGVCHARPAECTEESAPVCGCDGKTYSNACKAAAAGADVSAPGDCR